MGFFNKLFHGSEKSGLDESLYGGSSVAFSEKRKKDRRSCKDKIEDILNREWSMYYEIKKNISVVEVAPFLEGKKFTFGLYKSGTLRVVIRVFEDYNIFARKENRKVQATCEEKNIICINFFTYLPNEVSYIEERFRNVIY